MSTKPVVKVKKPFWTPMPVYAHDTDSGADLKSLSDHLVKAGESVKVETGIAIELPSGYEAQIRPRSSMSAKGLWVAFGTIDTNYRGTLAVIVRNLTNTDLPIYAFDKVAQLVIVPVVQAEFVEVDALTETDRGTGGFGSTGK